MESEGDERRGYPSEEDESFEGEDVGSPVIERAFGSYSPSPAPSIWINYSATRRLMSVIVKCLRSASMEIYVKGAPEVMADMCDKDSCGCSRFVEWARLRGEQFCNRRQDHRRFAVAESPKDKIAATSHTTLDANRDCSPLPWHNSHFKYNTVGKALMALMM